MNVAVLLAAGASRRMGSPKALRPAGGESFLVRGVRTLWTSCDVVVVVLGANARRIRAAAEKEFEALVSSGKLHRDIRSARRHGASGLEVRFVVHKGWARGMLSSVQAGLRAALRLRPEAVLVMPVDHPSVRGRTVAGLAGAMGEALQAFGRRPARSRFAYALIPRHRRRRGHPIVLSPALARAVGADRAASDLSDAVRRHARLVGYLDCRDAGILRNRNTPSRD